MPRHPDVESSQRADTVNRFLALDIAKLQRRTTREHTHVVRTYAVDAIRGSGCATTGVHALKMVWASLMP
jgi:hypothetical protein